MREDVVFSVFYMFVLQAKVKDKNVKRVFNLQHQWSRCVPEAKNKRCLLTVANNPRTPESVFELTFQEF